MNKNTNVFAGEPNWKIIFVIHAQFEEELSNGEVFEPSNIMAGNPTGSYPDVQLLFRVIAALPWSPDVPLWIIYNRVVAFNASVDDKTYILRLNETNQFEVKETYSDRNLVQKARLLSKALTYVHTRVPSMENLLFTWGHGSAFGMFKEMERFTGREVDGPFTDILSNDEMADALYQSFGTRKVAIIAMTNCAMLNMFTCYALKYQCRFLIAPMGTIEFHGYNYPAIWNMITHDPTIQKEKLAEAITETIKTEVGSGTKDKWAVFAADLQHAEWLISFINKVAQTLMDAIVNQWDAYSIILADLPARMIYFDNNLHFVDLKKFLVFLHSRDQPRFQSLLTEADELAAALFLPNPFIGARFKKNPKPTGLGFFFPLDIETFFLRDQMVLPIFFNSRNRNYARVLTRTTLFAFLQLFSCVRALRIL